MKKLILAAVALGALGTGGAFAQVLCGTANTPQCPNPATAPYYQPNYYPHPSSAGAPPPQSWAEAATAARVWSGRDQYAYGGQLPWLAWDEPYSYRDRDGDGVHNRRDRDRDGDGIRNWRDRYPDDPRFR